MRRLLASFLKDEHGQDLIEYALLASFIGLVGIAAFSAITSAIGSTYTAWNSNENNNWQMPDPGSGGS